MKNLPSHSLGFRSHFIRRLSSSHSTSPLHFNRSTISIYEAEHRQDADSPYFP